MASPLSADRLVAALQAEGATVVEYKSWRGNNRNHKGAWGPVHGVMIHHTVTTGVVGSVELCYNGRSDLPGPLCHGVIAKDGTVYLVGNGRANHAGSGDGDVLAAVIDERPLPADNETDTDGNRYFYGFECVNLGDNKDPWPPEQVDAIVRASAALCRAHGWGGGAGTSVIGHLEWQPGKVDPRGPGISMSDVRRRVAERLTHPASWSPGDEEDDVPLSDDDVRRVAHAVATYKNTRLDTRDARQMWDDASSPHRTWQFRQTSDGPDAWGLLISAHAEVTALRATVGQLAHALGEMADGLDADDLVARIDQSIAQGAQTIADQMEGLTLRVDVTNDRTD